MTENMAYQGAYPKYQSAQYRILLISQELLMRKDRIFADSIIEPSFQIYSSCEISDNTCSIQYGLLSGVPCFLSPAWIHGWLEEKWQSRWMDVNIWPNPVAPRRTKHLISEISEAFSNR